MAIAQFSTPKQWEDWCSWLLGIWLCLSPWTLGFGLDSNATEATVVGGLLIIAAEVVTLSVFRPWEEWINVVLGVWLIICPWIAGVDVPVASANLIIVGLLVMVLALYEIWGGRHQSGDQK